MGGGDPGPKGGSSGGKDKKDSGRKMYQRCTMGGKGEGPEKPVLQHGSGSTWAKPRTEKENRPGRTRCAANAAANQNKEGGAKKKNVERKP